MSKRKRMVGTARCAVRTAQRSVPTSPIGRSAVIRVTGGEQYVGTVIDATGRKPKRIRIQSPGRRQGDVVMPGDYVVMEFI